MHHDHKGAPHRAALAWALTPVLCGPSPLPSADECLGVFVQVSSQRQWSPHSPVTYLNGLYFQRLYSSEVTGFGGWGVDTFIWVMKFILPQLHCPLTPAQPFPDVPATRGLLSCSPSSPMVPSKSPTPKSEGGHLRL